MIKLYLLDYDCCDISGCTGFIYATMQEAVAAKKRKGRGTIWEIDHPATASGSMMICEINSEAVVVSQNRYAPTPTSDSTPGSPKKP